MVERVNEIKMRYFKHEYYCEECEAPSRYIEYTRPHFDFWDTKQYQHECSECEQGYWLDKIYPYIETVECEF